MHCPERIKNSRPAVLALDAGRIATRAAKAGWRMAKSPRGALALTALCTAAAAMDGIGYAQNLSTAIPAGACTSPAAFPDAQPYADPGADLLLQTQAGLFIPGVIVRGEVPPDAYGVEAVWKYPGASDAFVNQHASAMFASKSEYALKMAEGPGQAIFGVRFVAPAGSPWCVRTPHASVQHLTATEYFLTPGTIPWVNFSSGFVNVFAHMVRPSFG